jgi:hypothetical protein
MNNKYVVSVGNIGSVYSGNDQNKAVEIFDCYVEMSEKSYGRASGEEVTMFEDDEIVNNFP